MTSDVTGIIEEPEFQKPQIHFSHLDQYFRCGEQYRRRHILGEKIPPGIALIAGTGGHKAFEADMKAKISTGELLPHEQVLDIARDATNSAWELNGAWLDEEERERGWKVVKGETVDMVVGLADVCHRELAPTLEPESSEEAWVIRAPGYDYDFAGQWDLIEKNGVYHDLKTRGKTPPAGTADSMLQVTMYTMAARTIKKQMPEFQIDYLVKTKTPKVVSQRTTRTTEDIKRLLRLVERYSIAIEKGIFLPAPPGSWICSPKHCGYYPMCSVKLN